MSNADSSLSSIYNEQQPSSSNFMYSGTYTNNVLPTTPQFSLFTPDSKAQSSVSLYKTQIACVPDITIPLVKNGIAVSGLQTPWGSSNALLNSTKTKSYKCIIDGQQKYITVTANKLSLITTAISSPSWNIHPVFCNVATNTTVTSGTVSIDIKPSTVPLPFNKFIALVTPSYISNNNYTFQTTSSVKTTQTVSVKNTKSSDMIVNLKMYLCASTGTSTSADYNPYGVKVTIRDSTNPDHVALSNNVYCISSSQLPTTITNASLVKGDSFINPTITLTPGQIMNITLMKIIATNSSGDSSVLFIDLDGLLYIDPTLILTSQNTSSDINYLDTLNFNCQVNPSNINNDNLNGEQLTLEIYKSGSIKESFNGTVSNGNATFSIPITDTNKSIYTNGSYTAIVKYVAINPADSEYINYFPDIKSHYNSGSSNVLSFNIVKKPIIVNYDSLTLSSEYSILQNYNLSQFILVDTDNNPITIPGTLSFNFWENTNNNWTQLITINNTSLNVAFMPKNIGMKISSAYKFNYTFTPSDTNIIPYTKYLNDTYIIYTETPILTQVLYNSNNIIVEHPTVSYTENITVSSVLKDKSNNVYEYSIVNGTCIANVYEDVNDSSKNINLQLSYDSSSKTYKNTFSSKSINLLRYNLSTYTIKSKFNIASTDQLINSTNESLLTFNGVDFITTIENVNPNIYDNVRINSVIKDKFTNQIYSIDDISGQVMFNVHNSTNTFNTATITSQTSFKYIYSFVPTDLSINYSNNPLQVDSQFVFSDSQITSINKTNSLNISLITPTITITPHSKINDYHYNQTFNVTLTGIENKNDTGTLYLYGKSTNNKEVVKLENVTLNGTYIFADIDIDELVEDDVLSTLQNNQVINGRIQWVPTNVNAYNSSQDIFTITLSKTSTNFSNIVIENNQCSFTNQIIVRGKIISNYTEAINGSVCLYDGLNLVSQSVISTDENLNNLFALTVTSDKVTSYYFTLKFIPLYNNVYYETVSDVISNYIEFRKVSISPLITIYDLNTNFASSSSTNMVYTHNFKIGVENMSQLNNTTLVISIENDYVSSPINIANGKVLTDSINFVSLNTTSSIPINIVQSKNISLTFSDYNSDDLLKSLYSITQVNTNITFIKDVTVPKINNIQLRSLATNNVSTSLNFEEEFDIIGSFNLIKDENNTIIPISGVVKLYVGSTSTTPKILNNDLTISNSDQLMVNAFKSSDYDILAGHKQFIFEFVPNDVNISTIFTAQLDYTITTATISEITLNLFPQNSQEQTLYKEDFEGTLSLFNIGAIGTIDIYCINPNNTLDLQLLSSIPLLQTDTNKNTQVDYSFTCNAITFDCYSDTTTYDIVVKYQSGNVLKYDSHTMTPLTPYSYSISKIAIHLSELFIDNNDYTLAVNGINKYIGDTLTIRGKIKTQDDVYIDSGKVSIITFISQSDDGNYYNNVDNRILLTNGIRDPDTDTDYVEVNSNGEFTCSIFLSNLSPLYLNSDSYFQILYRTNKNFINTSFSSYEDITGVYPIKIDNKDMNPNDFAFTLQKSALTNSYSFPFHEDMLHFTLEINEDYSVLSNTSPHIAVRLYNSEDSNTLGQESYVLNIGPLNKYINGQLKTICFAELYINPKTEDIPHFSGSAYPYSASCIFDALGYNSYNETIMDLELNTSIYFNIQPTSVVVEVELKNPQTGLTVNSINYEENVNIQIKVRPSYPIQPNVNQNKNIMGSVVLRNQNNNNVNGTVMKVKDANNNLLSAIVFNSVEESVGSYTNGIVVNYAPKNNSDLIITAISKIFTLFQPSSTNYENVSYKYNDGSASPSLYITKYTPILETLSIYVINDISHETPVNKVDEQRVYYDNVDNIKYYGVINFDEEFKVNCSLNKNIAGNVRYYYSTSDTNVNFTEIYPKIAMTTGLDSQTDNTFVATFNSKLIPIPINHIYYLKTVFTPATALNSFYNSDDSSRLYFNVYQSNKFGTGRITWDTENNAELSKTRSYTNSQTINITVSFDFDAAVLSSEKKCEVTFYHTDYENESNKFYTPIYLDLSNQSNVTHITTTVSMYGSTLKFKPEAYSIRALFKPVLTNNTRNINYPIVIEINPLTLIIKPFITTNQQSFNYQYSDPLSLTVTLNAGSGITELNPYSKLVFKISGYTSYSKTYEQSFTGTVINFPNFNEIINTGSTNLEPESYTLSIYATNDAGSSVIKTDVFSTRFDIYKKQVTLSLNFDKYDVSYRGSNTVYLNIGSFPIDVGQVRIAFTNAQNESQVANRYINSSQLVTVSANNYTYTVPDMSLWAIAGVYKVVAYLDNMYYSGSQLDNSSKRLLVTKETNCEIVLSNTTFDVAYGSNITINSLVKYNNSEFITGQGQLGLTINNNAVTNVASNFVVSSASLNKDINNLVLNYISANYVTRSLPFKINVTKQIANMSPPNLTHNVIEDTDSTFKLHLANYNESDSIIFYKLTSITKLNPIISSSGVYTFNLSDLSYGSNTLYAVLRSSLYDIQTTEVIVIRNKYEVTIVLDSASFNSSYKANSPVDIRYKVTKNSNVNEIISNNGSIEFHKLVYEDNEVVVNHDEIIGYSTVINNTASILQYKLAGNSHVNAGGIYYDNKIRFYAKFINSIDFKDSQPTTNSSLIIVTTKDTARIIDDNSFTSNYKLGDTVSLEYIVIKSLPVNTTDENVNSAVNAQQSAIENLDITNKIKAINQTNYNTADAEFNSANTRYLQSDSDLTAANTNKINANNTLLSAQTAVVVAKSNLDMVTTDKIQAELAFKTMQEVSKLSALGNTITSSQISLAEIDYNTASSAYNTSSTSYNSVLTEITGNQTILTQKTTLAQIAESNRDSALLNVSNKETELNGNQIAYETAVVAHNVDLKNVSNKQAEIITLSNYLSGIEEDYETKQSDYTPKLLDYQTKQTAFLAIEPNLLQAKQSAESIYNSANTVYTNNHVSAESNVTAKTSSLSNATFARNGLQVSLASETSGSFTLNNLTNMWAVIDQQSTSATPENPFFVVYTLKDNATANASWYKSKQFYGSAVGAEIHGPMFIYTGEDPVTVHAEITNRVKLEFNNSLSVGLQNASEIVKAISIQTSSQTPGNYNFIFREFGTIGTTASSNLSFIPTSINNTVNIYADGVKGTDVENGWSYTGAIPKINWYLKYNSTEELTTALVSAEASTLAAQQSLQQAQQELDLLVDNKNNSWSTFQAESLTYNTAKKIVDDASAVEQISFSSFNPVKLNYDNAISNKTLKEQQLVPLQTTEAASLIQSTLLKTNVDASAVIVGTSKTTYDTKLGEYTSAKAQYDAAVSALQISNNKLTVLKNGITIVQELDNLLGVKNTKYIVWKSYIKYTALLAISTSLTINSVIAQATSEVSATYDTQYSLFKSAITNVTNKQQLYDLSSAAYTAASAAKSNASTVQSNASTVRSNALTTYWNYYNNVWQPSLTASNDATTAARNILVPIAITRGYVVFYKTVVIDNVSMVQILAQMSPNDCGIASLSYKLVDVGSVKFHAKLVDLPDYYDVETLKASINVIDRNDTIINNTSIFNSELYKSGDSVSLSYSVVQNNINSTPITDGTLAIYKKVGTNEQLLDYVELNSLNNGIISHNHILIDSGSVIFYAKYIYSTNNKDKVGFEQSIQVISKLNSTIEVLSILSEPYKLGNSINIKHKLTSTNIYNVNNVLTSRTTNVEEGSLEIHKVVNNLDEVIGNLILTSGSNGIIDFTYDLVDTGLVSFYALYKGTKNYETSSNFINMRTISVLDKYVATVTNVTEMAAIESKKLGDLITLKYNVSYNNAPVTEGKIEISKCVIVNGIEFKEILGYTNVNSSGQAVFTYNLVDVDCQISLSGNFINSVNYKEITSMTNFVNKINVYSKYNSKIIRTSVLKDISLNYKLGDLLFLEYKATNNDSQVSITDGIISIHKVITGTNNVITDDIIYYAAPNVSTGKVSYTHKIDNVNSIQFYAEFNESLNYYSSSVAPESINVIKEYTSATNTLTLSTVSPKYSDVIVLTSVLVDRSEIINEGVMEFYVTIPTKPIELIGTSSVSNNSSSINYTLNDVDVVTFSSIFKNSTNYIDVNSSSVSATVIKSNITSLSVAPVAAIQFDIVDVVATINFGREVCYTNLGKIEFTITNNNIVSKTEVDVINNKSTYKLFVSNKLSYTVDAKFTGNPLFNISSISTIIINPTVNSNYKNLIFTENSFSGVTNYFNIIATISLNDNTVDEKFMLINTGFVVFESYKNGVLQNLASVIVPLSNGTAQAIMRQEAGYTYIVKFVDVIVNPNITLIGTK